MVHAAAHITGGGLESNLARMLPPGLHLSIEEGSWEVPAVFTMLAEWGDISPLEMTRTFNMGIGFCLLTAPDTVTDLIDVLGGDARVIGRVQ
jgi:phosphoribosylformylglycinamidine cyclo-ligase